MEETLLRYVIPGIIGLVGGVIGSLIAPWVHWGVEKRKIRQQKRRELINSCRVMLAANIDQKTFQETELYLKLRPHLYQLTIEAVEKEAPSEDSQDDKDVFKEKVFGDLARIEKEWVLI